MADQLKNQNDSIAITSEMSYGIKPFDGVYNPTYSYKQWVLDVTVYAQDHLSKVEYHKGEPQTSSVPNWVPIVLIIVSALVAYSKSYYGKRFNMILKGMFNWKVSQQIIRYEKVYAHPVNLILTLVFLITTSLFFTFVYHKNYNQLIEPAYLFALMAVFLLAFGLVKLLLYSTSAWLFDVNEVMEDYSFQNTLFNKLYGLLNLVLITFLLYAPINDQLILGISLVSLLIFMLMQLIRGLLIGIQNAIPVHLIILYLCTLEILPWLIIGKWIGNIL